MKNISEAKILCIALATLMFSLILISAGSAAIGVEKGDWAKYRITAEVPQGITGMTGYEQFERLDWVKVEVESVSGTSVTLKMTIHYKDGTEDTQTGAPGTGFIIDTDLGKGDAVTTPIFGSTETTMYITGSKQRAYAGASREVNYVDFDFEQMGSNIDLKAYWDKETGILCEMAMSMSGELMGQTVNLSISIKMTETNLWEAGLLSGQELWILIVIIIIVVVVVAVSAVLLLRRRKTPLPEVAPAPTE